MLETVVQFIYFILLIYSWSFSSASTFGVRHFFFLKGINNLFSKDVLINLYKLNN